MITGLFTKKRKIKYSKHLLLKPQKLKTSEHSLDITMEQILSIPNNLNNGVIKHKFEVPCKSFEENCVQTRTFSNTPFNMRGNHFLVHETEKEFASVFSAFLIFFNILS